MTAQTFIIFNIIFNSFATIFLLAAIYQIKKKNNIVLHKRFIFTAVLFSILFLTSYLCSHFLVEREPLKLEGLLRTVFFVILATHTPLAVANLILIPKTIYLAITKQLDRHRKIAPWTFGIWLYVASTGIIIFLLQS
jgi:putative membrane protein